MGPVTGAAVASELKSLARVHAPFCATSAPAARGMRVTLDFEGFLEGAPIPDSRMEQVTVTLGTAQLMPAAEQAVYGHCAGETFRFDFTYPDEFRVPELSGKRRSGLGSGWRQQPPALPWCAPSAFSIW